MPWLRGRANPELAPRAGGLRSRRPASRAARRSSRVGTARRRSADARLRAAARCSLTLGDTELPAADDVYEEVDVRLGADGLIEAVAPAGELRPRLGEACVDARRKLLLPGFVNARTAPRFLRGLIPPLPLDLWVLRLLSTIGDAVGRIAARRGAGADDDGAGAAEALGLAALHCAVESLLGGCTAVIDHCWVGSVRDAEAVVAAYRQVGVRIFFAPMLNDDAVQYENYVPVAEDGRAQRAAPPRRRRRPAAAGGRGRARGRRRAAPRRRRATRPRAAARSRSGRPSAAAHRPAERVEIVIGPVTAYSCSVALLRDAAALRRAKGLHGHIHLLESRAQKMEASRRGWPGGSAVQRLEQTGFLHVQGTVTSCAHCCWLEEDDMDRMAKAHAAVAHNPLSNLRLGSGICQVRRCLQLGVGVGIGCDGACSSDGQDMTEAIKAAALVSTLASPDYREWLSGREALRLACAGGAAAVGLADRAGRVARGRCRRPDALGPHRALAPAAQRPGVDARARPPERGPAARAPRSTRCGSRAAGSSRAASRSRSTSAGCARGSGTRCRAARPARRSRTRRRRRPSTTAAPRTSTAPRSTSTTTRPRAARSAPRASRVAALGRLPRGGVLADGTGMSEADPAMAETRRPCSRTAACAGVPVVQRAHQPEASEQVPHPTGPLRFRACSGSGYFSFPPVSSGAGALELASRRVPDSDSDPRAVFLDL